MHYNSLTYFGARAATPCRNCGGGKSRDAEMKHALIGALFAVAGIVGGCGGPGEYPTRPVTIVVPWGAGGGTDAIARMIASMMEKEFGKPVNVVNRAGGNGVIGHQAVAAAKPDGYTLGLITAEIAMMHWQGLTELSYADYTPIALMSFDPAGVQVRADAPYRDLGELVRAIRAQPGRFKASGCGQGCGWQVALYGMLSDLGVDPSGVPWVPSNGAAPGLLDLVAGGVDIVPCSLPEARSLIDAGRVNSLAIMHSDRAALFPDVPTLEQATGSAWTYAAWRGIAGPKGLPADITTKLQDVLKRIFQSDEFREFMDSRGFGMQWADAQAFGEHMRKADETMGRTMKAIGMTE
jgi:tripartite-type tricarboxylate transporter receptor subunit TctC